MIWQLCCIFYIVAQTAAAATVAGTIAAAEICQPKAAVVVRQPPIIILMEMHLTRLALVEEEFQKGIRKEGNVIYEFEIRSNLSSIHLKNILAILRYFGNAFNALMGILVFFNRLDLKVFASSSKFQNQSESKEEKLENTTAVTAIAIATMIVLE
uniref:Uncharacterized protein n=1 Tax=Glossina pallidipes TaxID=7398 RepID=A0A1A9ZJG3_GLOPL